MPGGVHAVEHGKVIQEVENGTTRLVISSDDHVAHVGPPAKGMRELPPRVVGHRLCVQLRPVPVPVELDVRLYEFTEMDRIAHVPRYALLTRPCLEKSPHPVEKKSSEH